MTYHNGGLETRVTDALGQLYIMNRNALGWLTSATDPNAEVEQFGYDLNGNLARYVNRRGQVTTYAYDTLNNLRSRNAAGQITTYSTHPHDLFSAAATAASVDTIYYNIHGEDSLAVSVRSGLTHRVLTLHDIRGRAVVEDVLSPSAGDSIVYSYNNTYDRVASMSGPHGNTTFTYDNANRQTATTFPTSPALSIQDTYTDLNTVSSIQPSGAVAALQRFYVQDSTGRSIQRWNLVNDTMRMSEFSRGRLIIQGDLVVFAPTCTEIPHWGYHCDDSGAGQVREWEYNWDKVGNPQGAARFENGWEFTGATVQTGNRLTQFWDYTMGYDDDGNMTSRADTVQTRLLYWNSIGLLDSVRIGSQLSVYGYDGWGRRVTKTVSGVRTEHLWSGNRLIAEINAGGTLLARYGYVGSRPIWLRRSADTRYYVQENAGNVTGMFNVSRQVTQRYEYRAFGSRLGPDTAESFHNSFRFAGQYFDRETGMYYMRARYYDPEIFRFISEDPIGLAGGLNAYEYAGGDPVNFSDPSGLQGRCGDAGGGHCPVTVGGTYNPIFADAYSWNWYYRWIEGIAVGLEKDGFTDVAWDAVESAGDVSAGFGDVVSFGGTKIARERGPAWLACPNCVDYESEWYTAGQVAGGVTGAVLVGSVMRKLGVRVKFAYHPKPHPFRLIGPRRHLQMNIWRKGVRGSGVAIRIPLPGVDPP